MTSIFLIIIFFFPLLEFNNSDQDTAFYIINEEFSNLDNWEDFQFSGNKNPTKFIVVDDSNFSYLKIISDSSASGLIHKNQFDPKQYPILSWRWKIENIIEDADGQTKSGDDYPLRLFVMFDDDSAGTSFWTSLRNSAIKLLYGAEPPESSLCFVWSNQTYTVKYFDSPYSATVKIIPMAEGANGLKTWHSYRINIDHQFREIFDRPCPGSAKIAIMGDTDNTESTTLAGLDYIRIGRD
jgi:hypothetical protein